MSLYNIAPVLRHDAIVPRTAISLLLLGFLYLSSVYTESQKKKHGYFVFDGNVNKNCLITVIFDALTIETAGREKMVAPV